MGSHVVSFRFSDKEIELLRQHADSEDESTNAIAQRLLRKMLGKQAPGYKAAVKALDRLIAEMRSH